MYDPHNNSDLILSLYFGRLWEQAWCQKQLSAFSALSPVPQTSNRLEHSTDVEQSCLR